MPEQKSSTKELRAKKAKWASRAERVKTYEALARCCAMAGQLSESDRNRIKKIRDLARVAAGIKEEEE